MSVGNLLDIASRAMSVYQDAMSVTGQNITNANNTNYSKQKVILASDVTVGGVVMVSKLRMFRELEML